MGVIQTSIFAFLLHEQPFERFRFARWQSVVAITLLGICSGLNPNMAGTSPDAPHPVALPLWGRIGIGVVTMWLAFWVIYGFCRWWLKRGGRWDGQGDLFNLMAASWLVVDLLGFLLSGLGVPDSLVTPVWFYSIWVGANAMSGAIPKSSLGYGIGGIILGGILAIVAIIVLIVGLVMVAQLLGAGGMPAPAAG